MSKEIRTSGYSKIKRMFELQSEDNSDTPDYQKLCYAIKGRNYKHSDIRKAFLKLMDIEQYPFDEREYYIKYLYVINERNNK